MFAGSRGTGGCLLGVLYVVRYRWLSLGGVVCCQVEVSATGRSLVQRNPTNCGVSECGLETQQ